jgi:hypothetical protein
MALALAFSLRPAYPNVLMLRQMDMEEAWLLTQFLLSA